MTTFAETPATARKAWERLDSYLSVLGSEDAEILRSDIASLLADVRPADGRMARSHHTRRAIVDAMRALHAEGDLRPTAPRVAARAGVSLRTVWQHFADMEALLLEAGRRILKSCCRSSGRSRRICRCPIGSSYLPISAAGCTSR